MRMVSLGFLIECREIGKTVIDTKIKCLMGWLAMVRLVEGAISPSEKGGHSRAVKQVIRLVRWVGLGV